jgi:uncharacterized protein (TIGR02246 family)
MIRFESLAFVVAGLVLSAGGAHAATPATAADEAAIRAQTTAWEKAYNGGDPKGVAAQYADDAVLLPPGAPAVKGRAAIQAFFTKDIADSKAAGVVFVINYPTDVGVSGNMGWESGTYKATVKGAVVETGKFMSVSRKKDGKWLYLRDTWNQDAPPAPAAAPSAPAAAPAAAAPKK